MTPSKGRPHLWTVAMVETGLQLMIQVWEQCNQDVHGRTEIEQEQEQKLLQWQRTIITDLISRQDKCLPKDQFLFPTNPKELLTKTSTTALGNWILTQKPAILRSQQLAQEQAITNTKPIKQWFKPIVQTKLSQRKIDGVGISCCLTLSIKRNNTKILAIQSSTQQHKHLSRNTFHCSIPIDYPLIIPIHGCGFFRSCRRFVIME